jgi:hypothetical protein
MPIEAEGVVASVITRLHRSTAELGCTVALKRIAEIDASKIWIESGSRQMLPEFPPIPDTMSLAIDNGEQNAILYKVLTSYWLL